MIFLLYRVLELLLVTGMTTVNMREEIFTKTSSYLYEVKGPLFGVESRTRSQTLGSRDLFEGHQSKGTSDVRP